MPDEKAPKFFNCSRLDRKQLKSSLGIFIALISETTLFYYRAFTGLDECISSRDEIAS